MTDRILPDVRHWAGRFVTIPATGPGVIYQVLPTRPEQRDAGAPRGGDVLLIRVDSSGKRLPFGTWSAVARFEELTEVQRIIEWRAVDRR